VQELLPFLPYDKPQVGAGPREIRDRRIVSHCQSAALIGNKIFGQYRHGYVRPHMIRLVHSRKRPQRKQGNQERERRGKEEAERQSPDQRWARSSHVARIM
jgi:hypothetical protein